MNQALPPYPAYQPAGLPWLKQVPAHWEVVRLKNVSRFITSGSRGWAEFYSETGPIFLRIGNLSIHTIDLRLDKIQRVQPPVGAEGERTKVVANDLLISITALLGAVGVVPASVEEAYVNQHTALIKLRLNQIHPRWAAYCLYSPVGKHQFGMLTNGGTKEGLTLGDVGALTILLPPLPEQQGIVAFLDGKTRQIARLLRHKRQLIKLLTEQKQALIHRAVTRGLDPAAPRKASGVAWLGEVPAHWEVRRLKTIVSFNPSKKEIESVNDGSCIDKPVVFLPMENVSVQGDIDCSEWRDVDSVRNGFPYFRRNDVIVAKITPCFENGKGACLSNLTSDFGFGSTEFIVLRAGHQLSPAYLYLITASPMFRILGADNMTGAAGQQRVSTDFIRQFQIGIPRFDEQQEIISFVESESQRIDQTITRAEREIELLQEYRTRLVADVVTGRVDVRGAAGAGAALGEAADDEEEELEESELEEAEAEAE